MPGRPIVFISDFGLEDEFVGICHGVIARVSPDSTVIDLTHGVPPHDVLRAAVVLAQSVPFMPEDGIFLAVVDPGVGTDRRAVAVECRGGGILVGPDNGVLSLAWAAMGGVGKVVEIASERVLLPAASRTFHGRDVFAPAAAHLASGTDLDELGPAIEAGGLAKVTLHEPVASEGLVEAEVLAIDRFGNVQLNVREDHLRSAGVDGEQLLQVRTVWQSLTVRRASTFGDVAGGEFAAVIDSGGWLAVVRNGGSAAVALRLEPGNPVVVEMPERPAG